MRSHGVAAHHAADVAILGQVVEGDARVVVEDDAGAEHPDDVAAVVALVLELREQLFVIGRVGGLHGAAGRGVNAFGEAFLVHEDALGAVGRAPQNDLVPHFEVADLRDGDFPLFEHGHAVQRIVLGKLPRSVAAIKGWQMGGQIKAARRHAFLLDFRAFHFARSPKLRVIEVGARKDRHFKLHDCSSLDKRNRWPMSTVSFCSVTRSRNSLAVTFSHFRKLRLKLRSEL